MGEGSILQSLRDAVPSGEVLVDEPMRLHTSYEIGGPAEYFVKPGGPEEVAAAIQVARGAGVLWRVMGQGSNVLVADEGLPGVTIQVGEAIASIEIDGCILRVEAGATNEEAAEAACAAGLAGYEFASGIPGSIGGAAIMNAGAYDGEFRDVCVSVTCLAPDGAVVEVPRDEADWGYRHSMMSDRGYVILAAVLELKPGDPTEIRALMDELKERRESKQPLELPSAGSTFKRPKGYFAGKLIQEAGMRGHRVGGAQVSEKHCGFVVNTGGATAADVLQVIEDVRAAVRETAGVELEPEVRLWK
ncbi:MAG: UDP-N-acetylmuramate dehydrogenase [Coriobacteriales bacterium]|jgi:UDP-N-acetylmuramate dehydrogenase